MRLLLSFLVLAVCVWAQNQPEHGAYQPGGDSPESKYLNDPAAVEAGGQLYATVCSGCHGPSGEGGRGPSLIIGRAARQDAEKLLSSIKNGVPGSDMPPFPLPDEQLWQLTAFVSTLSAPAYKTNVPGDPDSGEALFFGKAGCSNCHMIRGRGGSLGPDLSNAGLSNYMIHLREGLLEANKRISPGYDPVRVVTHSGGTIEGVAKNYTNYSIQVLDAKGELHLLPAQDVREVRFLKNTWMPSDYAERFSEDELQNILAFLSRQASREPLPEDRKRRRRRE